MSVFDRISSASPKNGPMVVFLCSDEANYITGQVFGTEGDTVSLLSQPKYSIRMTAPGGWTVEGIQEHFKNTIGNKLEPFSLSKPPHLRSSLIHGHHLKQHAKSESYERKCYNYNERTITFTRIENRVGEPC